MKILWLTSWYPNKTDAFTGDFIQRHAQATAPYASLTVIHVQMVKKYFQQNSIEIQNHQHTHFTEQIVYVKPSNCIAPFNILINQILYLYQYKKAISKYIQQNGKPQLVHVHIPIKAGIIALWLKFTYQIKYVLSEHYGIYNNYALNNYQQRPFWFKYFTKKIVKNAVTFLPVSNNLGNAIGALVTPVNYTTIMNVVDTSVFHYNPNNHNDNFLFVHVSFMNHAKNTEGIIRAFATAYHQNSTLRLRLVGPIKNHLTTLVHSLQLSNVVDFVGLQPQHKIAHHLKSSNAFVLFSNYENMPCVIAEALCCGLPIISTNVGGIPEIIDDSNGILLSIKDEEALSIALLKMANNYSNYNLLDIATKAADTFGYLVIGKKIAQVYQSVL